MLEYKDCSIIIVNWNGLLFLQKCLPDIRNSIRNSKYSFEIFLVDNASSDGSCEFVSADFPEIRLIRNQENLGFAKANNMALRQCNSKYILLVNNDIELPENVLDEMISYLEQNPKVGVSGCQLITPDNTPQRSFGDFHTFGQECKGLLVNLLHPLLRNESAPEPYFTDGKVREVDYICGAFFLIRKSVVDQIGMLDESYFFYVEELDFCYRLKRETDFQIAFLPDLKVVHHGGGSSSSINRYKYQTQLLKSKLIFARKYYSRTQLLLYRVLSILTMVVELVRKTIKFLLGREENYQAFCHYFKNTVTLYI